jgi:hypothetical protein
MISVDAKGSLSECPTARLDKRTEWPQKEGGKIQERGRRVPGLGLNMLARRSPIEVQQKSTDRPCHVADSKKKRELSSYALSVVWWEPPVSNECTASCGTRSSALDHLPESVAGAAVLKKL